MKKKTTKEVKTIQIWEIIARGIHISSSKLQNLVPNKPTNDVDDDVSCVKKPLNANDEFVDNYVEINRPPYYWRVDLGKDYSITVVVIQFRDKWGKGVSMHSVNDAGKRSLLNQCTIESSSTSSDGKLCCMTNSTNQPLRWIEINGTHHLPKLLEVKATRSDHNHIVNSCPTPAMIPDPMNPRALVSKEELLSDSASNMHHVSNSIILHTFTIVALAALFM